MVERSVLESEALEVSALAAQQFERLARLLPSLAERLDRLSPALVATIARGSSDNAAAFGSYLLGLRLGLPAASLPPSLASVYGRRLRLERALVLAVSQSGASPDLSAAVASARAGGAFAIGVLNEEDSALAREMDAKIAIGAGAERAVAATKSFVLSLTALVHLIAAWTRDAALSGALQALPETLAQSGNADWSAAIRLLVQTQGAFVVGRGPTLPVAREFALKLKEVGGIHAEAVSAAELLHGPISIASPRLPAIAIAGDESTRATLNAAVARLRAAGAPVVLLACAPEDITGGTGVIALPMAPEPLLQPIVTIQAAYPFFAEVARARGRDPDHPPQLQKVTRTL
ncbi:MAG TPA: SIS domain-containing protein [Burkholderiales bacterium]|nr:SIS domain-containing protein [Burkholderiales bacterium]